MNDMFGKEIKEGSILVRPIISFGGSFMGNFRYEVKNGRAVLIDNDGLDEIYDNGSRFDLDEKLCKESAVDEESPKEL